MSNNAFTCDFCNQDIKERVFVSLNSGIYFHTAHFRCSVCEANLCEKPYYKKAKKYFCEEDYHKLYSPCCDVCKGPIKEQYITAFGKPFHIDHFYCTKCHSKFIDGQYYKVDNQAFCRECYSNFAGICSFCQKFIIEKMVTVCRKNFHKECLFCAKCNKSDFMDDLYYEKKDKIYHENCYKDNFYEKCSLCKNFCELEYTAIEGKPFHNECLELYKDYAKKLIDEELSGKQEEDTEEQPIQAEEPENHVDRLTLNPQTAKNNQENNNEPELKTLTSSIRKKDQMLISNQKVSFHLNEINEGGGSEGNDKENEKNNENNEEIRVSHSNLAPHIENKIRNSIKLLENDIKTLEIAQKKSTCFGKASILRFSSQRKETKAVFPYNVLKATPPKDIDLSKREFYVLDEDFESIFKMKKSQFYSMPKWRQIDLKKKHGLF